MENGRIAIPSNGAGGLEGTRSGHFGHCDVFTLIDVEDGTIKAVSTMPNEEHVQGGCMVPVNLLANHNVTALVVGGIGMRPLMGFKQVGIDVYHDGERPEIKPVVADLTAGKLAEIRNDQVCGGGGDIKRRVKMKIAVTSKGKDLDSPIDPRFGRAAYILMVEMDDQTVEVLNNSENANALKGAGIQAAAKVADQGAEVLLTGFCGPNAFKTLNAAGVKVANDVAGTVRQALEAFNRGDLPLAEAANVEAHW